MSTATTDLSTADICDKAADIIETNGFCRGYLYDTKQAAGGTKVADCRVDIIGAINVALYGTPRYGGTGLGAPVEQAIAARIDAPSIVAWCERKGNNKAQAIRLLRGTAKALREES